MSNEVQHDEHNNLFENIVCEQCGSSNIEIIAEDLAQCRQCGSKIKLSVPKIEKIVNHYHSQVKNEDDALIFTKERSVESFRRDALVCLASDIHIPQNIFESQFSPVKSVDTQYAEIEITLNATFSATIGYDRVEEYKDYDSVQHKVVTKRRRVTDWKPFSGSKTNTNSWFVNISEDFDDSNRFADFLYVYGHKDECEYLSKTDIDVEILPVRQSHIDSVVSGAKSDFKSQCQKSLPGDTCKDFVCSISYTVNKVQKYIVPQYILPFKYNGREWDIRCYKSATNPYIGHCPDGSKIITNITNDKTKGGAILSISLSIISILMSLIVAFWAKSSLSLIFSVLLFVASVISFVVQKVRQNKITNSLKEQYQNKKKHDLQEYFAKHNIKPLTEDEEKKFDYWRKRKWEKLQMYCSL